MNLTRCNQGHFYDADKFETCPHCTSSVDQGKTVASGMPGGNGGFQQGAVAGGINNAGAAGAVNNAGAVGAVNNAGAAAGGFRNQGAPAGAGGVNNVANGGGASSFKNQVDDVQKTVGMFRVDKNTQQPVAGWLVCIEGPHFGEDFRIVMGRNFLGRAGNMDIVLAKDNMISRDKHAIIIYEPKGNIFIIQAGESKELFYLNDSVVLSPTEMKPYDTITIGASKLLFVPFCSDNFNWNDIKKEDEEEAK